MEKLLGISLVALIVTSNSRNTSRHENSNINSSNISGNRSICTNSNYSSDSSAARILIL